MLLNVGLFASAARLTRDRLFETDMTDPVGVSLITLNPEAPPPPPPEKQELPKPKPRPQPDFTPELSRPSIGAPDPLAISVQIEPSLFVGAPLRGDFVFNATDLDSPPTAMVRTNPVYPYKARQRNIEGSVEVKFLVGTDGAVSELTILDSQPKGLFDAAVMKTVPRWKFRAGVLDGQQVPSWVVTTIQFTLNN